MAAGLSPMMRRTSSISPVSRACCKSSRAWASWLSAVRRVSVVLCSDASAVARFAARESVLSPRLSAVSFSDPARVSVSAPTFCKLSASDASSPFSWSL